MRAMTIILTAGLLAVTLAGCASEPAADPMGTGPNTKELNVLPTLPGFQGLPLNATPMFSLPKLIDTVRAGGEPVIAQTLEGTILVSAHPGWTHYHPSEDPTHPGTELLTPASGQSYLWRSTDGGDTWTHIGLPISEEGPRSTGFGVSDPEFTVMDDNTVCYTDLMALVTSSIVCSVDDGLTWLPGNEFASGGVNDRQWIASYGNELYFTASYFASTTGAPDHHIRASTDRGLTWEDRGNVPCSQDLVANRANGHLIVACGAGIAVSEDAGWTWERRNVPDVDANNVSIPRGGQRVMAEPAIDSAGNTWVTWTYGENQLLVGGSPDEGLTWPWIIDLTPHFRLYSQTTSLNGSDFAPAGTYDRFAGVNGSYIWPWISAGSDGRVAVTWIGGFSATQSNAYNDPWFLFTAYVLDAAAMEPTVFVSHLTPTPIHHGPICQSGTTCQVTSVTGNDSGDRRLGDFFETTIDSDGYLHAVVSDTYTQSDDVVSHATYVRQIGGIQLINAEDLAAGWRATQG